MSVVWTATASSGRFGALKVTSSMEDFATRLAEMVACGEGYLEVRSLDRGYPYLALGFRAGHAVIHCARSPESMSLLAGDGSPAAGAEIDVPIMDGDVTFSGEFALPLEHATDLLLDFAGTGRVPQGEWWEL